MRAHIVHDDAGNIKAVVFQSTDVQGELEIQSDQKGESVTAVDLGSVIPGVTVSKDADPATTGHYLDLIGREIRSGFRFDKKSSALQPRK
jgi:hypothetical protein